MEQAGLSPPSFDSDRHEDWFKSTYLFHHFLSEPDVEWLGRFQSFDLTSDEQRALIFLRETGRITNADYRDLNRVDTLTASQHLARLRDLDLLAQVPKGAATYYVPGSRLGEPGERREGDLFQGLSADDGGLSQGGRGVIAGG
jgi:ATP-dependent DNA helicase RecG